MAVHAVKRKDKNREREKAKNKLHHTIAFQQESKAGVDSWVEKVNTTWNLVSDTQMAAPIGK